MVNGTNRPAVGADAIADTVSAPPEIIAFSRASLARVDTLATELAEKIIANESGLSVGTVASGQEIREACRENLGAFYRYLAGITTFDRQVVRALGRHRAEQGVPLTALLDSYRIAVRFVWENLVGYVAPADGRMVRILMAQADLLWQVLGEFSTELREGHGEVVAARARQAQAQRNELLDILVGDGVVEVGRRLTAAGALGLPVRGRLQVAVVHGAGPGEQRKWEARLVEHGITSVWRMDADEMIAVLSLAHREEDEVTAALGGDGPGRIGLSPMFDRVVDAGQARHRAQLALRCVPAETAGVCRYGADPVAVLVACAPQTSRDLAERVLGDVMRLPEDERRVLLATVHQWFEAGGSTVRAAAALYCHRNTVRYRLRRIEDITGFKVDDPRDAAQLYLALQAVAQFGTGRLG